MRLRLAIVVLGVTIGLGARMVEKWVRIRRATQNRTEPADRSEPEREKSPKK